MFSFFSKTKIAHTSSKISQALTQIFSYKKIASEIIDDLEEVLIINDLGVDFVKKITQKLRAQKFSKEISLEQIKDFLREEILTILEKCQKKLQFTQDDARPRIIVFNGVNGAGKTTTIGKIAANLKLQNKKILIVACDTFRAAAFEQLQIWAKNSDCEIISANKEGDDPASVAFRALDYAKKNGHDVLLIDTAGRLQNKQNLMEELKKINNVLKKIDQSAPHENILVLDANVGQNAHLQVEIFSQFVNITGLVITKLDGSAKAGVVVSIAEKFQIPIYAIGIGEKIDDLQDFSAKNFVQNLL